MSALRERPAPEDSGREAPPKAGRSVGQTGSIAAVFLVLMVLIVWQNPNFLEPSFLLAFFRRAAPLAILAAGQLFVIVAGGFDLSVGSVITATVVVAARVGDGDPAMTAPVILLLFALGALVGLVNGLITTKLKVPSFITTLGMLLVLRGAVFYWTDGAPTGALADNLRAFGRSGLDIGRVQVPFAVPLLLVVVAGAAWLLHRSVFGQQVFAAGGGPRAASLSGVNVPRVRTLAFVLSALAGVAAGILLAGIGGLSAQAGEGYEFQAISAVVLGGAALGGGRGSLTAVVFGALTLEALFTLLNLLGLPQPLRETAQGLIIIGAVLYAAYRARRAA